LINDDIIAYIEKSILCWLATASADGIPNVSPKEIFCWSEGYFLIANIASPGSMKNIKQNNKVCISFIDILEQKGYQLKGEAELIDSKNEQFQKFSTPLKNIAGEKYPFHSLIKIEINSAKPILAPSYLLYPDMPVSDKINAAKKQYVLNT